MNAPYLRAFALAVSALALTGFTLFPPLLYAAGRIPDGTLKILMLLGTLLWFASASLWMGREKV